MTKPTIVTKPVVNRMSRTRRTYSVAGWVQLGTTTAAVTSAQVRSVSDVTTAGTADPVELGVTIQRYTHSRWSGYRTVSVVNPPARYTTHVACPPERTGCRPTSRAAALPRRPPPGPAR